MEKITITPQQQETTRGWIYFAFQMTALQYLLSAVNYYLGSKFSETTLNIIYFTGNFLFNVIIFRGFLKKNLCKFLKEPGACLGSAALGLVIYYFVSMTVSCLCLWIYPEFSNINDNTILKMIRERPVLMTVSVVLLVPTVEELVFRGLIFRPLYNQRPWLGYCVSAGCFSLLHILGYVTQHDPISLLLCFVQYIPAGLVLGWSYARSNTIWTPILIHTAVNLISILVMR